MKPLKNMNHIHAEQSVQASQGIASTRPNHRHALTLTLTDSTLSHGHIFQVGNLFLHFLYRLEIVIHCSPTQLGSIVSVHKQASAMELLQWHGEGGQTQEGLLILTQVPRSTRERFQVTTGLTSLKRLQAVFWHPKETIV